ncbi:hypothetical protein E4T56_gene4697 [Termitomyces sp. T112]|nr:hypothetical protein E4T56_gene4697 [Termitomyces sp. T112]
MPMTSSWERLKAGKPHFGFDTSQPTYLAVMPRKAGTTAQDIRWFKGGNCFTAHVMNAYQDGTKLHLDLPVAANNMMPFFPDINDAPFDPAAGATYLTRWTVDLAQNEEDYRPPRLSDLIGEFPRIDDRFTGQKNRYGWMVVIDPSQPVEAKGGSAGGWVMNTLGFVDLESGTEQKWWCGPVSSIQEPCFVPRPGSDREGDGWIVMVCNRLEDRSSDLLIFEATNIAAGPVPTIAIPKRELWERARAWLSLFCLRRAKGPDPLPAGGPFKPLPLNPPANHIGQHAHRLVPVERGQIKTHHIGQSLTAGQGIDIDAQHNIHGEEEARFVKVGQTLAQQADQPPPDRLGQLAGDDAGLLGRVDQREAVDTVAFLHIGPLAQHGRAEEGRDHRAGREFARSLQRVETGVLRGVDRVKMAPEHLGEQFLLAAPVAAERGKAGTCPRGDGADGAAVITAFDKLIVGRDQKPIAAAAFGHISHPR